MKKTFRKALACLLAVLMVAFSVPFTALAGEGYKQWWVDEGIELSDITEAPDFVGFMDDEEANMYLEDNSIMIGEGYICLEEGAPDLRDNYKPILAITVTDLGTNGMSAGKPGLQDYFNTYYGYNKTNNYNKVNSAGKILNPGQLKKGQRIAVTFEMGGFDILANCMLKGNYDDTKLAPGYYSKSPTAINGDTWAPVSAAIRTGGNLYPSSITGYSNLIAVNKEFVLTNTTARQGDYAYASGYMGKVDDFGTGKYGWVVGTFAFEVLEDCDLTEALTLNRDPEGGCIAQPYAQQSIIDYSDGRYNINLTEDKCAFAQFAVIWENYEAAPTPTEHTHDYQVTETIAPTCDEAGKVIKTCTNADGNCDALTVEEAGEPALGHEYTGTVTANAESGKHNVQCTRCDATTVVECTYIPSSSDATCTEAGKTVYTCACGDSYTDTTGAALGHDFENGTVVSSEVTKAATCEEDGVRTIVTKCSRCDETNTTTEAIDAIGHDWNTEGTVTVTPDCQNTGVMVVTCKNDATHTKDVTLDKDPANHVGATTIVGAVEATCAKDGYTGDEVCACGETVKQGTVISKDTVAHTPVLAPETAVEATYDAPGKEADTVCSVCGITLAEGEETPILVGIQVTVAPSALGTATVNGKDVDDVAVTANVAPNSDVVLTATPAADAVFAGWTVDGKLVATDANITVKALADITYVPVFQAAAATFTVVFADRYGNVFDTQEVTSGAEINLDAVKAPTVAGYTFVGWSVEDVTTITEATTIQAVYEKIESVTYTVTANGCTITAEDASATDVLADVAYDTLVTVTAKDAKAWTINGATVAYGESYTFYVGSDVTVVPVFDAVTATPTVAAVSVTEITDGAKIKASFLATRSMTDDCTFVSAGFVYGKNLADNNITLADVKAGSAVKAYYCATDAEQFALTYSLAAQQGTMTARAFLAYVNAKGETVVIYAEPQTYTYA